MGSVSHPEGRPGPAVRLRGVVALLGRFPALSGADLVVERGSVVHLSGPNGAGKSTLLRLCAGLVAISAGEAEVLGHDLRRERRAVRRRVGLLTHTGSLYDSLTVEENIRFALRASGAEGDAACALELVELSDRLRSVDVGHLSAGQRRRVSLAIIAARRPEVWLLDEPHAGLDAGGRDVLDRLVREESLSGAAIIIASHELERAGALADQWLTVAGGQVHPAAQGAAVCV